MDGIPEHIRAGTADREEVVRRLNDAFGEGRLELGELEERVTAAYAARTMGDLRPLTADLPQPAAPARREGPSFPGPRPERRPARRRHGDMWRHSGAGSWLSVSLLCVMIWGITCLATGGWVYPWWIWVAGPWGALMVYSQIRRRLS